MKKADFDELGRKFQISNILARLIRNRDVTEEEQIRKYLYGTRSDLHSPHLMKDMDRAVELIADRIASASKIRVVGDYDVDGINATYILYKGLCRCGAQVDYDIPDRLLDGYGINVRIVEKAYQEGITTIITCDNGISAVQALNRAIELGMTFIITDHHQVPMEDIPDGEQDVTGKMGENREAAGKKRFLCYQADAILNPHRWDCTYPYKELCGAGVAFKLVSALYEYYGIPGKEAMDFLENVAIATVCDVVDLQDENRIMVKEGLGMLEKTHHPGLKALMEAAGLEGSHLNTYHLGFVIGPCINACGRLENAKTGLRLLLAEDFHEAEALASSLRGLNEERKNQTATGLLQAEALIEKDDLCQDRVLVIYLPDCHESLVGIIAGRLKEKYLKPVYVLTDEYRQSEESIAYLKGSGRSIDGYSMYDELCRLQERTDGILTKFGGHTMAAGLTIKKEDLEEFRVRINEISTLTEEDFFQKVELDMVLPFSYVTMGLAEELTLLEPYGKGNRRPLMARKNVEILNLRVLGKNRNVLKMTLRDETDTVLSGILFRDAEEFFEIMTERVGRENAVALMEGRRTGVTIDIAYCPEVNEYRDIRSLQICIQNFR